MLSTLPEVQQRYSNSADEVFKTAPEDIAGDFATQARARDVQVLRCTTAGGLAQYVERDVSRKANGSIRGKTPVVFEFDRPPVL